MGSTTLGCTAHILESYPRVRLTARACNDTSSQRFCPLQNARHDAGAAHAGPGAHVPRAWAPVGGRDSVLLRGQTHPTLTRPCSPLRRAQEQQLLAKYGLPPNTNREVLLRVLSSLNAAQSAAATTSAGVHSSSAGRGRAPWRAAGSAHRPTSRPVTPVNEFREPWSVAKPATASRSQEAERVASRRRVEELQAELDQRTVRLQATEVRLC